MLDCEMASQGNYGNDSCMHGYLHTIVYRAYTDILVYMPACLLACLPTCIHASMHAYTHNTYMHTCRDREREREREREIEREREMEIRSQRMSTRNQDTVVLTCYN